MTSPIDCISRPGHLQTASQARIRGVLRVVLAALAFQMLVISSPAQTAIRSAPAKLHSSPGASSTRAVPVQPSDKDVNLGDDWVRLEHDDDGKLIGMQTAIVRYATKKGAAGAPDNPVTVDLIGAVHIGDLAYYRKLNDQFKQYDALLYELVAPEGTVVPRGRGTSNAHPLGALQNGIKSLLELDHQLEEVDYTCPNFVHADMSPDQFLQAMKDRNEGFLQMYFRLLGQAMAHQSEMTSKGQSVDFELFSALFADDRPRRLKMALAKQLAEMEGLMTSLGGEDGTVIITDRNKAALKVLRQQLDGGKRKLGIFYGAGHLNDMDQRLRKEFGVEPVSVTWLTAWNLAAKPQ
jgi:hypothetical protein